MTFDYVRPGTIAEASDLLARTGAVALSGGTDLMVAMRHHKVTPQIVVDLKSVNDIGDLIEMEGDALRIGGRVVMSEIGRNEHVNQHFPALAEAAAVVGSIQIRNRATLAGNLCNASPAADTAPALLAFDASVVIGGSEVTRTVAVEEFFVGPGSTVLDRGELVVAIEIPLPTRPVGSAFARVTRRRGVDLASVNLACAVAPSGSVRFGFGAVGPTPLVAQASLDELADETGWADLLAVSSPISDVRAGADYRAAMLRIHAERALHRARLRLEATS